MKSGPRRLFDETFSDLKKYVGERTFLEAAGNFVLQRGLHEATVFHYFELDRDSAGMLVECQLLELALSMGRGWTEKLVPFAILDGESHPVPLYELDQQCNGILLLDLTNGPGRDCPIRWAHGPTDSSPVELVSSLTELLFSVGR